MSENSAHLRVETHSRRPTVDPAAETRTTAIITGQDGVIARSQALAAGLTPAMIRRKLRRRDWTRVYDGVYVNHTGECTWRQRAWSAVLDADPAAIADVSVLNFGIGGAIHIAVGSGRKVVEHKGVVVHHRARFNESVHWNLRPPRLSVEEAALDVADGAKTEREAIATLTRVASDRRFGIDAYTLLAAVKRRRRMRRREFLTGILRDITEGTCSVLEHRYLHDVERAHGLPAPVKQSPTTVGRAGLRDNEYPEFGLIVELDGRLGHDDAASRDQDLERDLDAATIAHTTIRLGYGQVFDRPCATAAKIAMLLNARGWHGPLAACPTCGHHD